MKVVLFFIALAATCISALTCGSNTCPSENACCNDFMMGPTCYDPKSHSCNTTITSSSGTTGYRLCGSGKVPCGAACYDQRDYFCCNGELKQNGQSCSSPQTSAPTSAPTSSPTSPATTSPTSAPTNAPTSSPSPVEATKSYSGTLDSGSSTWSFPKQSLLDGSCSFNSSVVVPYQTFEATFTTAGARAIEGLANGDLWRSLRIFVYSSQPSLSNPCAGLIRELLVNRGNYYLDTPLVHDWMFFSASTYYIVVTGGDGRFAFDISATTAAGQLTIDSSTPTWPQAYYSSSVDPYTQAISFGCSYYGSGSRAPFAQYSWTQDKDGIFDILVSGFFDTYSFSGDGNTNFSKIYMVLYDGAPSAAAISSNPCSAAKTLYSISSSVPGSFIPYVALTSGKTYTVVFGGNAFVPFSWILRVIPTRVRMFGGDRWVEPRNQSPCAPNGQYWSRYFAFYVTARGNGPVLIDTSTQSGVYNWVSAFSYLYAGANTIPPQSCPTNATLVASQPGPSQGVLSFDGQPGKTYTVVVSPYDPNAYQPVPIANVEYIFGGTVLDRPVVSA